MSEYIEIKAELSDSGLELYFYTNLKLAVAGAEEYASIAAMEEGSPVAQAMAVIVGIAHLQIEEHDLIITREADAPWHAIEDDVIAALKDFFL